MNKSILSDDRLQQHGDDFYELLMSVHEGLDFEQSANLNARLVLVLANEIGDFERLSVVVREAAGRGQKGDGS